MKDHLVKKLKEFGILEKLIAIGTDGSNNMTGQEKGLAGRMK